MPKSADDLVSLIETGDVDGCSTFFARMSEAERKPFAKAAETAYKAARKTPAIQSNPAVEGGVAALLACASLSVLKSFGARAIPMDEVALKILSERRPEWTGDYAEFVLDQEYPRWSLVRSLMRAGLCGKPRHPNYVLGMTHLFVGVAGHGTSRTSILQHLLDEPDLLDDVWRLFELEGGGEYSLGAHDKYASGMNRWSDALVELSRRNLMPRDRLLDESLHALDRGFAQFRAAWFSAFHEQLRPTIEERIGRAPLYLRLVASPIPPTVSFALDALTQIDAVKPIASAEFVDALRPALLARGKGTVKTALTMLKAVAARDGAAAGSVAVAAVQGLAHETVEVQKGILDLLEKISPAPVASLREAASRHAGAIAASLKRRLAAWLSGGSDKPAGAPDAVCSPTISRQKPGAASDLREEAKSLPKGWRDLAGVDAALSALERGQLDLAACPFDGSDIPRLDPAAEIVPLATLDELIDAAAAALELDDYDAIERVFEGVSRLCHLRPDDFERRTGPLRKRAKQVLEKVYFPPFRWGSPPSDLAGVLLAWISREPGTFRPMKEHGRRAVEYSIDGFSQTCIEPAAQSVVVELGERAKALAERVALGQSLPLLSAPTHEGGWIAPAALADRVLAIEQAAAWNSVGEMDQVLALLRLAPDGRRAALTRLKRLASPFARALRFALGEPSTPEKPAWLWVAASRARSPWMAAPVLSKDKTAAGPDGAVPAEVSFRIGAVKELAPLKLIVQPAVPADLDPRLLTVQLWRKDRSQWRSEATTVAAIRAAQEVWPLAMEAACSQGVSRVACNLDWWEARWENRAFLEQLLDPDLPLRPMARLLLALGLAAKDPGESGLAVDACIAAVSDGRFDPAQFGGTMLQLWPSGLVKLSRWTKTLEQVARTSLLHAAAIQRAIEAALRGNARKAPRDLQSILGLLQELVHETGMPIGAETRDFLSGITGSGQGAKAAKSLLSFSADTPAERVGEIMSAAVKARLKRAHRWQERGPL